MSQPPTSSLRTCDIVMKGGITSGVVYPLAIGRLAERFIFKNIGGTSAGAIAAAAAAAAEFRRQQRGDQAGFEMLKRLPALLIQKPQPSGESRLFQFFQPAANTRRVFAVLTHGLENKDLPAVVRNAMRQYAGWVTLGALPGAALAVASLVYGSGWLAFVWYVVGYLLTLGGAAAGTVAGFVWELVREVPRHGFGLCSGMSPVPYGGADDAPATALSVWLTGYLNETAGLPPEGDPLTFGQLWSANGQGGDDNRCINLEMMTTNLTHRRPFRLPFRNDDDLRENGQFFYRQDELVNYFPKHVVAWLIKHSLAIINRPPKTKEEERQIALFQRLNSAGYFPMPAPSDLPVVVATRMSLSFPFLLCAVPLHAIDWSQAANAPEARDQVLPERCWFSDGGMCSNFPLHFFDAALPRRPTFSIDLTEKPADAPEDALHPEMAASNSQSISERWSRFDTEAPKAPGEPPVEKAELQKLLGFIWAMIGTMQNWTDTTQGRLPGYRDRIVSVPLKPNEGGLNLNMPADLVTRLSRRGEAAAQLLEAHFAVPPTEPTMTWDNHRWIRLRAMLAALEKTLNQMVTALEQPENGDLGYADWVKQLEQRQQEAPSYNMNKAQLIAARQTLEQLRAIQQIWSATNASEGSPRPRPVLRPRPQI